VLRSAERTLTDKDISGVRRKVLAALERELEATLRQLTDQTDDGSPTTGD
jgi:hypothetical protein